MVTKKLKTIFLLTLFTIYLHGAEEVLTGFPKVDPYMIFGGSLLNLSTELFYWISHTIFWISLPLAYVLFNKNRFAIILFSLFGLFFIIEFHHIYKAFQWKGYYPGLITSLIYPIIGIFYYEELIKNWKKNDRN